VLNWIEPIKDDLKIGEMVMSTHCIACGMPMNSPEEHAMGNVNLDYCVHCARPDGQMQTYEEKLESLSSFMVRTQGFDKQVAIDAARNMMSRLPAWQGRAG
jgi:hypothetical protein